MNPVGKALWYVESHFASELSLREIAAVTGVSPYHLTRAFGEAAGYSIMQYVRARRLTEAARSLADGGCPIPDAKWETRLISNDTASGLIR